jgi:catechol 2,3-dioxygenase-like lactoylglutathione lyase family enzyme
MADPKTASDGSFLVGGIALPRPFRIRRLGHFGLDMNDVLLARDFYERLMGFRVSDHLQLGARLKEEDRGKFGHETGYFMRHGTDHHSFVIFPRPVRRRLMPQANPMVTVNQITWQVGSLREVVAGHDWLKQSEVRITRSGRDNPGSNWHVYPVDPDSHVNELYYGIEQIGWDGFSKPADMHRRHYMNVPELPHCSEYQEVQDGLKAGIDPRKGIAQTELLPEIHDVGGVLLGRPFKVTKIGPVRIFVENVDQALHFYRDILGLSLTEEVIWKDHRCLFLRANTEHHSLALYPLSLRSALGLRPETSFFSFGMQLGDYQQLRNARDFLTGHGVKFRNLPPEIFPGIDYSAFAEDPEGNLIQLY